MFLSRMKEYTVSRPAYHADDLGYETQSWEVVGKSKIYVVEQDRSYYADNDLQMFKTTYAGYTEDMTIQRGYLIESEQLDEHYTVNSVVPHRNVNVLYLERVEDRRG